MSDLISREAAIAIMCRAIHYNYEEGYAVAQMLALPYAQPESKTGRWYAVAKEMPEPDSRVLVYTVDHEYHVWDAMPNRADSYCWEDDEGMYRDKWEVELWMPIPEV